MRAHAALARAPPAGAGRCVIAPLSGCGSSHVAGTSADPATAVPAAVPLYAGAVVRPTGAMQTGARTAAHALTHHAHPYAPLAALQTPGSPTLNYDQRRRAVARPARRRLPVLAAAPPASPARAGRSRALLGGSSTARAFPFAEHGVEGAIVLDTSDAAKARCFLEAQATHAGAHSASYRGVTYQATRRR